jgi:hypothetical protein
MTVRAGGVVPRIFPATATRRRRTEGITAAPRDVGSTLKPRPRKKEGTKRSWGGVEGGLAPDAPGVRAEDEAGEERPDGHGEAQEPGQGRDDDTDSRDRHGAVGCPFPVQEIRDGRLGVAGQKVAEGSESQGLQGEEPGRGESEAQRVLPGLSPEGREHGEEDPHEDHGLGS